MNKYQSINSNGFELNYSVKGTGKPILVIGSSVYYPQLFSHSSLFSLIIEDLRSRPELCNLKIIDWTKY
ncbi:hypothetical protein PMSD_01215 [Paenibacillus macquariensis subsp. defensor]|nr:hypothetical protein PMSD_01215 [Paenibacillus macquariensis subsp. defensor]